MLSISTILIGLVLAMMIPATDAQGAGPKPGCLSGSDTVLTPTGPRRIDQLAIGDRVATRIPIDGDVPVYEPIQMFLYRDPSSKAPGIRIRTSSDRNVTLSPEHLIFVRPADDRPTRTALFAKNVQVGDVLFGRTEEERVRAVDRRPMDGQYAPVTESGVIVVNGILVSCYTNVEDHEMMHKIVQWLLPWTRRFGFVGDGIHVLGSALWDLRESMVSL